MISLTQEFTDRLHRTFGGTGALWLKSLPLLLDHYAERWSLTLGRPFTGLSYNYVTRARLADGTLAVLKLGVPNPELTAEIAALRHFEGVGTVKLIQADPDAGALLLESVQPGTPLLELNDDERATATAAKLIGQLHKPLSNRDPFPSVRDWGRGFERLRARFNGLTGPFPVELVEKAEHDLVELTNTQGEAVLLHADLHHWNILSSERAAWLAIDPKGLIGEPEYEAGAWLRNPIPFIFEQPDLRTTILRRVDQFVDLLTFNRLRVLRWGFYEAVLSAWWSFEASDPEWARMLTIAQVIASISH